MGGGGHGGHGQGYGQGHGQGQGSKFPGALGGAAALGLGGALAVSKLYSTQLKLLHWKFLKPIFRTDE